jgi:hypothetical protein
MLILDFDLDFIVRPIRRAAPDRGGRYEGPSVTVWLEDDMRTFLQDRLCLSKLNKTHGQACEHHKEVFFCTRSLIESGVLVPPFHWIHVDAHDDVVGCSDGDEVSSADFLLHLIGQNWLSQLDFVLPKGEEAFRQCLMRWDPLRIEFDGHRCEIDFLDPNTFALNKAPNFVFLSRSPDFTPPAADPLFELAKTYINQC